MVLILFKSEIKFPCSDLVQFFLVLFNSPFLLCCEFGQVLLGRFGEAVGEFYFLDSPNHVIIIDLRLEVKEYRQQQFLFGVDELLIEAETLNFGEIDVAVFWRDIVCCKSDNCSIFLVVEFIEDNCSLSSTDIELPLNRLELPFYIRITVSCKGNFKLLQIVYQVATNILFLSEKVYSFLSTSPISPICWQNVRQIGIPAKHVANTKHVNAMFKQADRF